MELQIETRKTVRFDPEKLKNEFPEEWQEILDSEEGDEERALREFVIESYINAPNLFNPVMLEDTDYYFPND